MALHQGNIMIIEINEQYRLRKLDKLNWIIEEVYIPQKGKHAGEQTWKNIGYFPRLDQAARFLFDKQVNESTINTLKDIEQAIVDSRLAIMKACKRIEKNMPV